MIFDALPLEGAYLITKTPNFDERGSFTRTYCMKTFEEMGLVNDFVQHNESFSKFKGTLRGLHFQYAPFQEVKLVTCKQGSIFDVIVDLRKDSTTFLKWYGVTLKKGDFKSLYIPEGFAHGFITLEDDCEISYLVSNFFVPTAEGGIHYMDPKINIKWPIKPTIISEKDSNRAFLRDNFKGI